MSRFMTVRCVCDRITFGLYPPLSFPGRPQPGAVWFCFLFQPPLQTGLCALRQANIGDDFKN